MEIERADNGVVYFYVDEEYLKKYGLELKTFRYKRPFQTDIFDDLLDKAVKEYGVVFPEYAVPKSIRVRGNIVIFEVEEKSNIIQLENKYIEKEHIAREIWELFRTLPNETIYMGMMDEKKKRELLEKIRSEKGIEYIRKNFID